VSKKGREKGGASESKKRDEKQQNGKEERDKGFRFPSLARVGEKKTTQESKAL